MALNNNEPDQKTLSAPLTVKRNVDVSDENVDVKVTDTPAEDMIPEPASMVSEDELGDLREDLPVEDEGEKLLDEATDTSDDEDEDDDEDDTTENRRAALEKLLSRGVSVSLHKESKALSHANDVLDQADAELKKMSKKKRREYRRSPDSKLNRAIDAYRWATGTAEDYYDSLKSSHVSSDSDAIKMNKAKFIARLKSGEENIVSGAQGRALLAAISGSVERVVLPNSGIHVSLRTIPLDVLNSFYTAASRNDYEYGRRFGEFYYAYNRLEIVRSFVDIVLPVAIFGSNYVNYRDKDSLYEAISYHDLNTLTWAISAMMYPQGVKISYHCAECGEDTIDTIDIYKLKLVNTDLLTPEVVDWLHTADSVTDAKLAEYRTKLNLDRSITKSIGEGSSRVDWTINLKQASLKGYLDSGREFLVDLTTNSNATEQEEVNQYMFYNKYKQYKPWIKSITCTVDPEGEKKVVTILNDSDPDNSRTISETLDSLRNSWEDMDREIDSYILSTRLMHTAFHMSRCPKCGADTDNVNGFIPFDALSYFFTLCIHRLNMDRYRKELRTMSKDTTAS